MDKRETYQSFIYLELVLSGVDADEARATAFAEVGKFCPACQADSLTYQGPDESYQIICLECGHEFDEE